MRENFEPSLDFTLSFEGGYVNHPKDPGGHTNKGVTLATLRRYQPGASVADLKKISDDMLRRIYRDGYWHTVNADRLAAGVDGATFDYAVNSGPGAAHKSLMKVIGGPDHETVKRLCARRLSIYRTFSHWKTFGKGWTRRVTAGEALWVKWALAARIETPDVQQRLEDEAAEARKKAAKQEGGGAAAGTGGAGGVVAQPELAADPLAGWILLAFVVAAVAAAGFLIWRSRINRARQAAYTREAEDMI